MFVGDLLVAEGLLLLDEGAGHIRTLEVLRDELVPGRGRHVVLFVMLWL